MYPKRLIGLAFASQALAQGDLLGLLRSQPNLSTLADLVALVPNLNATLSAASNITIVAPTNEAFGKVPRDIPEGRAIQNRNVTTVEALLSNHVFKGVYPSSVITEVPTFAQTLVDPSFRNSIQPFTGFTGGQYNGLVKNGEDVNILSGEFTISKVVTADVRLGEGITIHVIDTVLSFGPPLQLFTLRDGLLGFNGAVEAAELSINLGLEGEESAGRNVTDLTFFIPANEAFEAIGSILEGADTDTLRDVLEYHIIEDNVIFSPSLSNTSVPSIQGTNLDFTVFPDGSIFVNNAKIIFANIILFNGVAHIIDTVLNPAAEEDAAPLDPSASVTARIEFPGATSVIALPFTAFSFEGDLESYSTPELLKTVAAISVPSSNGTLPTATSDEPPIATAAAFSMSASLSFVLLAVVGCAYMKI